MEGRLRHVLRNRFAEMCYQDDIKREKKKKGREKRKDKGGRARDKEGRKKVEERGKMGKEEESRRRRGESAQDRRGGARGVEGIKEEQRCRVAVCEGAIERERETEEERVCGSKKRSGPTGVRKETSQALIGNLVDCQLQTNRKKRSEEERRVGVQAGGKAKPRREPARISEFLDNAIRTVPAFRPPFLLTTD